MRNNIKGKNKHNEFNPIGNKIPYLCLNSSIYPIQPNFDAFNELFIVVGYGPINGKIGT